MWNRIPAAERSVARDGAVVDGAELTNNTELKVYSLLWMMDQIHARASIYIWKGTELLY